MASPVQAAVQIATGDEMLRSINSVPGQLAGESIEEWLARTEFERVVAETEAEGAGAASPLYRWDYSAADELDRVVRETTADGAWENWGGTPTPQGAAAPSPSTAATPQTAIREPGATGASAGGLLSVPLPTWAAAAAPLLGVAVGVGLYESNPELWTRISQTLLPWCYPDTQVMPVIVGSDGQTYIDKEAVEALKRVLEEEGIPITGSPSESQATSDLINFPVPLGSGASYSERSGQYLITYVASGPSFAVELNSSGTEIGLVGYSSSSGQIGTMDRIVTLISTGEEVGRTTSTYNTSLSYTYDNKTVYYGAIGSRLSASSYLGPSVVSYANGNGKQNLMAWTAQYGNISSSGEYQEGVSRWEGQTVDIGQLPITEAYTDPTGSDTRDFIPAAMPTSPGVSVSSTTNPDPTVNSDPRSQITPYINPSISPDQYPSGSDSTTEDGDELDRVAPIPVPYAPTIETPSPDENPSEDNRDDEPPQRFVDFIPPIDVGDILPSPVPTIGAPTDGGVGGLVSVYNPTYTELQAFSQWLWVTYQDATIDKIWNNPFDGVIALYEIYCTPTTGARKYIKSGFLVSTVECLTVPNRYIEINCGAAVFPEYYGNYLDYSPYAKALCYLPFIGIVELNVDDIVGHAVNITYRVDVYTGACIALITCAREGSNVPMYQFSGNCAVQLPIAGGTQASIRAAQIAAGAYQNAYHIAGVVGLYGGIASGLFGNIGGFVSGIGQSITNEAWGSANQVSQSVAAKSSVQHSGQFGESYGAMGHKKPYMIIKRPVQVIVPGYQTEYGFQAHKYVNIGACTGFLRCREVHVQSSTATDAEKSAIESLLKSGVYISE